MKKRPDNWKNPRVGYDEHGYEESAFEAGADALFDAGYRPVPSVGEMLYKLAKTSRGGSLDDAKEICRWLLEGD